MPSCGGGGRAVLALSLVAVTLGGCAGETRPARGGPAGSAASPGTLEAGLEAQVAGRVEEAEGHYLDVLERNPQDKLAHYNLGLLAQQSGDQEAAAERYEAALAIDPEYVPALFNLAILRSAAQAPREAEALYRRVLAVAPDDANAHLNLGFVLLELGQTQQARQELVRAVTLDPALRGRLPTPLPS